MTTQQQRLNGGEELSVGSGEKSYGNGDASKDIDAENPGKELGTLTNTDGIAGEGNVVESDVPPNGGYGWVCVAACATINAYVVSGPLLQSRSVN